jgi:hypothetical protein
MSSSSSSTLQVIPQTRYRARPRSQSFNHTVIRRQPSESLLTPPRRRKASFEASRPITNNISTPPEQVSNAFLSVGEPVNCGASSIDESASDDEDSIHQSNKSMHSISIPTMNLDNNREGLGMNTCACI